MAPGTKAPLGGLQAVTVIPGHLQMGGTRTAAPFFAATRYARVLGCAAGLLVGVLGPPAVVGDLGSCPAPDPTASIAAQLPRSTAANDLPVGGPPCSRPGMRRSRSLPGAKPGCKMLMQRGL
jgi:hypothetical protein